MELSKGQEKAFSLFKEGKNVFISGPGGAGKSALIRHIHQHVMDHTNKNIQICALTGFAATQIHNKATTLHSWAGIGLGNGDLESTLKKIRRVSIKKGNWLQTNILIIDEVSQMSLKLFELLNNVAKRIRRNKNAFGGIQMVFVGDFYQIPPVGNEEDPESCKYCFESEEWDSIFPLENCIVLDKIFRQTDEDFSSMLNQIREGKISKKNYQKLLNLVNRPLNPSCPIIPTKLFPTKRQVDAVNQCEMEKIKDESYSFEMKYTMDKSLPIEDSTRCLDYLCKNIAVPKTIYLKQGCQVMYVVNNETGRGNRLVNGSCGIVTGFEESSGFPIVKFSEGFEEVIKPYSWVHETNQKLAVSQLPLILAWALTIHKAQGTTLDMAEIDIGNDIFEVGQTYVALSRVKTMEGLYLKAFNPSKIKIHKKVMDFYSKLKSFPSCQVSSG